MTKRTFLALIAVACAALVGSGNRVANKTAGGGGGPNTWYDIEIAANKDAARANSYEESHWQTVTVTTGGSATKARIYIESIGTTGGHIKAALYSADGSALLASGSTTVSSTSAGYVEITFSSPATVSSSTNYVLYFISDGAAWDWSWSLKNSVGSHRIQGQVFGGPTYAAAPLSTLPSYTWDFTETLIAGVYVQ